MNRLLVLFLMLMVGISSFAQKPAPIRVNTDSVNNRLHLNFVDVIKRTHVPLCMLMIIENHDTIVTYADSLSLSALSLHPSHQYKLIITKAGFDTLSTSWAQPNDTADVYVDFYMRKTGMTKDEKKEAYKQSRNPIIRTTGRDGGFEYVGVDKNHMCECRVEIYRKYGSESFWQQAE